MLLVGEANPYGGEALYPLPLGSAGGRLCRLLGLKRREYLDSFLRVNLFPYVPAHWSSSKARMSADLIRKTFDVEVVVMLGSRVSAAFGYKDLRVWKTVVERPSLVEFLRVPHPSGRCRAWNDPRAKHRLRRLVLSRAAT